MFYSLISRRRLDNSRIRGMRLAILLRGTTFFRSLGALIYFAQRLPDIELYVVVQQDRKGKEYDTVAIKDVQNFAPRATVVPFTDDRDAVVQLQRIKPQAVLTQDPYHQFPFLFHEDSWRVFGIAAFIDSLHHAWRVRQGISKKLIPRKLYFPCAYIRDKFFEIGAYTKDELGYETLGSPAFDHDLFLTDVARAENTLVLITPPPELTGYLMRYRLKNLLRHVRQLGWRVIVKDRVKSPLLPGLTQLVDEWQTQEALMPYASLGVIKSASLHVCGYSTSIFEARYFGRPTLNLDIALQRHVAGNFVKSFGLFDLYNSATCVTAKTNLVGVWERLQSLPQTVFAENEKFISPGNAPTMNDNASLRILRDIITTVG